MTLRVRGEKRGSLQITGPSQGKKYQKMPLRTRALLNLGHSLFSDRVSQSPIISAAETPTSLTTASMPSSTKGISRQGNEIWLRILTLSSLPPDYVIICDVCRSAIQKRVDRKIVKFEPALMTRDKMG